MAGSELIYLYSATGAGLANVIIRADKRIFDHSDYSWTIVPVYITRWVRYPT